MTEPAPRPRARSALLHAAAALAAALLLFHPVLRGKALGGHVLGFPPFGDVGHPERTPALSDLELVMLPNLSLAKRELGNGRIPLWNPLAGCGVPVLANEQSAVLHPFTLLALAAPWRWSLTLLAFLRFALAYAGVWLLARDLGTSAAACTFAAAAHSLAGVTVAYIGYPVGAVFCHVPWLLLASRRDARGKRGGRALLLLTLVSSILAGHFEYLIPIWCLAAVTWVMATSPPRARCLPRLLATFLLAVATAGVMLLPCAEYLARSTSLRNRGAARPLQLAHGCFLTAMVDPSFLRVPSSRDLTRHGINPLILASAHVGSLILPLAFASLARSRARILSALVLAGVLLLSGGPLASAAWSVPPLRWMGPEKLVAFPVLALSLIGALGIDALQGSKIARRAAPLGLICAVILAACEPLLLPGDVAPGALRFLAPGGALLSTLVLLMRMSHRHAIGLLMAGLLAERSLAVAPFNCWDRPDRIYPQVPVFDRLLRAQGRDRIAAEAPAIYPNIAPVYGIRDMRSFDGLGVEPYQKELGREGNADFMALLRALPSRVSRLAAAAFIVLPEGHADRSTGQLDASARTPAIHHGASARQDFRSLGGSISSIGIFAAPASSCPAPLTVRLLRRAETDTELWRVTLPAGLQRDGWRFFRVKPSVTVDDNALLSLVVTAEADASCEGLVLGAAPRHMGPRLQIGGRATTLALAFKIGYGVGPRPHVIDRGNGLIVVADPESLPRARLSSAPHDRSAARIVRDDPSEVVIETRAERSDRLVLADTDYPGWHCRVDGVAAPCLPEGPFRAVALGPGSHRIDMRYLPMSYRLGLFMTGIALAAAGATASSTRSGVMWDQQIRPTGHSR